MKVVISANAKTDLGEVADWISQDNPAAAARVVLNLRRRCLDIGRFPNRFQQLEQSLIRRRVVGSYLIFYLVSGPVVEIVRILHGARDYAGLFNADAD